MAIVLLLYFTPPHAIPLAQPCREYSPAPTSRHDFMTQPQKKLSTDFVKAIPIRHSAG